MNFRIHQPLIQQQSTHDTETIKQKNNDAKSFKQLLRTELVNETKLKMSKHAETRFQQRGIALSNETWNKVEKAVDDARTKGVKEALILTNSAALVVSTTNKLIITALDRMSAREHLFTNIDGTVVIDE
ncbi:TIGR02530 family flagellar biosynthesis protein [Pueribacillus sp. YX66]|uniref:TIGR02530 family flagellar biosynthesis protein n=1 Tax=Pueribacillus sp. YX66 TaxID=3229242 RepID=UPI00358D12B7